MGSLMRNGSGYIDMTAYQAIRNCQKGGGKMPINSKAKGARFERMLASLLREYGYTEARRTAQYCGNTGDASDVVGLPRIHIEAKHQEKMELYKWMEQAKRDAEGSGGIPTVFHKKNNAEILVTMQFDSFMQLYKGWIENETK